MATRAVIKGPYKLVTVNTAPERATRLVARMVEALKERYEIIHVANVSKQDEVYDTVAKIQPDVLFSASMWTAEEAQQIQTLAKEAQPKIVTYAIPHGLQVEKGPDAIVEHLLENVPKLLDSI